MRGVVFTGERQIEMMEFPDPTPGPGEVVVEMKASGMCGSDLHQYRRPKSGGACDRRSAGQPRPGDRRARAVRDGRGDRRRRQRQAGPCRSARHGASLQGLHGVRALPLRLVAVVPGRTGPGIRQQCPWRARALSKGTGLHVGAARRRAQLHDRSGDLLWYWDRLWRIATAQDFRRRHDRSVRPGPGRIVGDPTRRGDGRPRHRARCQSRAAGACQGVRGLGNGEPALERPGRRDQGPDPWRRRFHARHVEPTRGPHRGGAQRQGLGHGGALSASATM